jgi:hypothetical protein
MQFQPFNPHYGSGQQVTLAAGTPQTINLSRGGSQQFMVWNSGATNKLYFCTFDSSGTSRTASATDCFVPPGAVRVFTRDRTHDRLSLFSAAGTTVEVINGEGSI